MCSEEIEPKGDSESGLSPSFLYDKFVSEGIAVAAITGLSYIGSFLFEVGRAEFYGLPIEIVSVGTDAVLLFFFLTFISLPKLAVLIQPFLSIRKAFLESAGRIGNEGVVVMVVDTAACLALWVPIVYFIGFNLLSAIMLPFLWFLFAWDLVLQMCKKSDGKTLIERLYRFRAASRLDKDFIWTRAMGSMEKKMLLFVFIYLVVCFGAGYKSSSSKKVYFAMADSPSLLLVAKYGDLLVFRKVDSSVGLLKKEVVVKKVDESQQLNMITVWIPKVYPYSPSDSH